MLKEMKQRSSNFNSSYDNYDEHKKKQLESYNKLSQDVKDFYINYFGFLDLVFTERIDIEKNRFLKQFPSFRKEKRQRQELNKQMEIKL